MAIFYTEPGRLFPPSSSRLLALRTVENLAPTSMMIQKSKPPSPAPSKHKRISRSRKQAAYWSCRSRLTHQLLIFSIATTTTTFVGASTRGSICLRATRAKLLLNKPAFAQRQKFDKDAFVRRSSAVRRSNLNVVLYLPNAFNRSPVL